MENQQVGIVGAGWAGAAFARLWQQSGGNCWGTTTREERQNALRDEGLTAHLLHLDAPSEQLEVAMPFCSEMVLAFPPGGKNGDRSQYPQRLEAALTSGWKKGCRHFFMLSSTSVYRNTGTWIDEDHKDHLKPESAVRRGEEAFWRGLNRLGADEAYGLVFRLAGLFGPGRHPGKWLAGRSFTHDGSAPVNLVHQADVAGALKLAITSKPRPGIYNLCCATHPSKKQCYGNAAKQLKQQPPAFTPGVQEGFKLVARQKWIAESGYRYRYSDVERAIRELEPGTP